MYVGPLNRLIFLRLFIVLFQYDLHSKIGWTESGKATVVKFEAVIEEILREINQKFKRSWF